MKIQVLTTPGCSTCNILEKMLDKLGVKYDLIDVTENPEYLQKYPIFTAPGLVINEKLEFTGIPKIDELKKNFVNNRQCFLDNRNLYFQMLDYSMNEKMIIVQYGIKKYDDENTVVKKLKSILTEKDIQRSIDTLIGTQKVRRIGPKTLQNNESHTELPELPENLKDIIDNL